jgi:hypothetical protein
LIPGLGVQKQVVIATIEGILPQGGKHRGGETLTLVQRIYSNILEKVTLAGTCGDQFAIFPYQCRRLREVICTQPGPAQKSFPAMQFLSLQAACQFQIHDTVTSLRISCYYTLSSRERKEFFKKSFQFFKKHYTILEIVIEQS